LHKIGEYGRSMNAIHEVPHPFLENTSIREPRNANSQLFLVLKTNKNRENLSQSKELRNPQKWTNGCKIAYL